MSFFRKKKEVKAVAIDKEFLFALYQSALDSCFVPLKRVPANANLPQATLQEVLEVFGEGDLKREIIAYNLARAFAGKIESAGIFLLPVLYGLKSVEAKRLVEKTIAEVSFTSTLAEILGALKTPEAFERLSKFSRLDTLHEHHELIYCMMGQCGREYEGAVSELLQRVDPYNDRQPMNFNELAIRGLGETQSPKAIEKLIWVLQQDHETHAFALPRAEDSWNAAAQTLVKMAATIPAAKEKLEESILGLEEAAMRLIPLLPKDDNHQALLLEVLSKGKAYMGEAGFHYEKQTLLRAVTALAAYSEKDEVRTALQAIVGLPIEELPMDKEIKEAAIVALQLKK